jgi:transcriptional regulator with XRE-family HTH domain
MLITPQQIKAGRAMLDWSAEKLGRRVGLTKAGISNIETGRSSGSVEVMTRIMYALQSGGLEFTEAGGVQPRQSRIVIYRGQKGFRAFFDDIYEVARTYDDPDICVNNTDEATYDKWLGAYEPAHVKRMTELENVRLRVLMKEQDTYLTSTTYCSYRWVPLERFADVSFYIYGDKYAYVEFFEHDVTVTVVENQSVAIAQRKMFDLAWEHASESAYIK